MRDISVLQWVAVTDTRHHLRDILSLDIPSTYSLSTSSLSTYSLSTSTRHTLDILAHSIHSHDSKDITFKTLGDTRYSHAHAHTHTHAYVCHDDMIDMTLGDTRYSCRVHTAWSSVYFLRVCHTTWTRLIRPTLHCGNVRAMWPTLHCAHYMYSPKRHVFPVKRDLHM